MRNKGTFGRLVFALSLVLSLGFAPGLTVYAQQAAQKQATAPRVESAVDKAPKASEEKLSLSEEKGQSAPEGEPQPLSEAEMEKVEGGWIVPVIRIGITAAGAYMRWRAAQRNHCR